MTITTITIVLKNAEEQMAIMDTTPKGKDLALANVVMGRGRGRGRGKEMVMVTVNSSSTNNKVVTTNEVTTTKEISTTNEDPLITIVPITSSISNKACVNLNKGCANRPLTKTTDVLVTGIVSTVVVITTRPKLHALNAQHRNRLNWMRPACHQTIFDLVLAIDTKPNPVQVLRKLSL